MLMQYKKCSVCKQLWNSSAFGKDKSRKDGLNAKCKACDRELAKAKSKLPYEKWYQRNYTLICLKRKQQRSIDYLLEMAKPPKLVTDPYPVSNIIKQHNQIWDHRVGKYIQIGKKNVQNKENML